MDASLQVVCTDGRVMTRGAAESSIMVLLVRLGAQCSYKSYDYIAEG